MRIQHNIMAMNTWRQLGINNLNQAKSTEKLSSGYRINRAADDASGLYISEKMRSQIRGLNQASANAQDGISLIQAAEGALQETHSILQRMRELAVKGANDINETDDDRRIAIQSELNALNAELDRISSATEFNKKTLLNGSLADGIKFGTSKGPLTGITVGSAAPQGDTAVSVTTAAKKEEVTIAKITLGDDDLVFTDATLNIVNVLDDGAGGVADLTGIQISKDWSSADVMKALSNAVNSNKDSLYTAQIVGGNMILTAKDAGDLADVTAVVVTGLQGTTGGATAAAGGGAATVVQGADAVITDFTYDKATDTWTHDTAPISFKYQGGGQPTILGDYVIKVGTGQSLTLQVGANAGVNQTIGVSIGSLSSFSLGTNGIKVDTNSIGQIAIESIDGAIGMVSEVRANLGALQNRLEHTVANLDTISENLQSAEAAIRDVDMAKEMMAFTKNNILMQAATAMLAQANQAPQTVLQLLR